MMILIKHICSHLLSRIQQHLGLDFSEEQMRAYFTKDDTFYRRLMRSLIAVGIPCTLASFISNNFAILACVGGIAFALASVVRIIMMFGIVIPTDEEFDAWIQERAREQLTKALKKIDQDYLSEDEVEQIPFVQGFVLAGTKNAQKYRSKDIYDKPGKDGVRRYSINRYTYFLPVEHQLAVFVFDINAVNHRDHRELVHEYFYADIVAATTEDDQDLIVRNGQEHSYRTQSFSLRISDGNSVRATFRSFPLDHEEGLPTYDLPHDNVEATIAQLRMLLRTHKRGYVYVHSL